MSRAERSTPSGGGAWRAVTRRLPLELKLPLLMSAVMVAVLFVALLLIYATLRDVALSTARDKLTGSVRQLVGNDVRRVPFNTLGPRALANRTLSRTDETRAGASEVATPVRSRPSS